MTNRRASVTLLGERALTAGDIARLEQPVGAVVEPIKKVSQRHHSLARCIAMGMNYTEAALTTGYGYVRIASLMQDKLFQELIAFYKAEVADVFRANAEQLQGLTNEALTELRERLENSPDKISTRDMIAIAQLAADRSGHGPQSTQTNVNVNLSERMKNARERKPPVIDGEARVV